MIFLMSKKADLTKEIFNSFLICFLAPLCIKKKTKSSTSTIKDGPHREKSGRESIVIYLYYILANRKHWAVP